MKRIFNITNIYLLLLTIFQLQGIVYEGGGILSKFIIVLLVLYMIIVAIYANLHFKLPRYFIGLNLLLIIFTIYGFLHIADTPIDYIWATDVSVPSYTYLLNIYLSLLPIYVFYIGSFLEQWNKQKIQRWTIILLVLSVAKFYTYYLNNTVFIGEDEITNNYGYLFVGIITLLVFFDDKSIIQYTLLAICIIMVLTSMKRGAIITASFCLIPFAIMQWKNSTDIKRIALFLILMSLLVGVFVFIQHMLQTSDYFLYRFNNTMDGDSSERDVLYRQLWQSYVHEASFVQQLFGGGANYTLLISSNFAHNDWLEILINQGLGGCVIYVIYWYFFWKEKKSCVNISELSVAKMGLTMCFIASFIPTLFSMSYGDLPIGETMTLGISLGQISLFTNDPT